MDTQQNQEEVNNILSNTGVDPDAEIDVFIDSKIFTVKMSGFFAKRLQSMANWILTTQETEKVLASYENLAKNPTDVPTDVFEFNLQTLLILMKSVEESALEQEATEKSTFRKMQQSIQDTSEIVTKLDADLDSEG